MPHVHRFRPLWLLVVGIADYEGYHPIITHAQCITCGTTTCLKAWQSPRHLNGRVVEEDEA